MADYELRCPTDVSDVALVCRQLAERRMGDSSVKGIFHRSGPDCMTKYQMAMAMADVFGLSCGHVVADREPSVDARRPFNSRLDTTELEQMGIGKKTGFREGIARAVKEFL
ncbi:methionine adenosyltransferase 2 subunit beta-like [Corticium candelabrum]|uniref:methionine adenosyltransferase 2 subunit beta-like n=1 Tax=Corticium candelabrum TaxID=121492 RepID=UPI002E2731C7|nr:methionine adenosyltransferase 2 subunit beta-like [Corticium candelabrum]